MTILLCYQYGTIVGIWVYPCLISIFPGIDYWENLRISCRCETLE